MFAWRLGVLAVTLPVALSTVTGCTGDQRRSPPSENHAGDHKPFSDEECRAIEKCLPDGLTLDTPFAINYRRVPTTVRTALEDIDARCRDGKIYDGSGKEVRFFPIPEGEEVGLTADMRNTKLQRAGEQLHELRRDYHVIEMYALTALPPH
jgi:hypothetical protein